MAQHLNKIDLKKFPAASSSALEFSASTDSASAPRLRIEAGGKLTWGGGTVVGDTNLYRSAADTLKTDDYLIAQGGLTVESYQVTTAGASSGTVLKFDGTKFAPGIASTVGTLDDLSDVVITTPSTNQALIYNGTQWVNGSAGAAGSTYVATIGNGASTTFVVSHGLNTRDVFVQVRNANSPYEVIDVQWEATSTSTVTFNFSTPPASNSVRVAIYSATTGTNIALPLDGLTDVTITIPEEFQSLTYNGTEWVNNYAPTVTYVRNVETTTLTTGTVVYLFGATGDHATVKRASKLSDTTSSKTIGLVAAPITANNNGPVVTRGYVDGIDLSVGYTAGDILWLDTNGNFTKTKAVAPDHLVFIGVVVRATNNGIVYVATQNGYELDELHNVSLPNPQSGDFLKYNGSLWVADAIDLGTDTTGSYVQSLVAGTGITLTNNSGEGATPTIAIGQAVATNSNVTFNTLTTSASASIGGNLLVSGDLTVNGTTTTINSTVVTVDDILVELGSVTSPTDVTAAGGGIVLRGTTDKSITWGSTNGWTSTETFNLASGKTYRINGTDVLSGSTLGSGVTGSSLTSVGTITSGTWSASFGAVSGANLTNLTAGNLTGTIPSTVLANSSVFIGTTSVALNRASSNLALTGISSITLPGATSGTVQLTPAAAVGTGTVLTIPATTGTIVTTGDTGTVTSTMIADGTIVNGDINASAAIALSKLASGTAGQLVVANASGVPTYTTISGDITINSSGVATIAADSVVLGSDTTGNYVASVSAGTGVTVSGASGEGWTPTISIGQSVGTSDSPSFAGITVGGSVPAIYATMGSNKVGIGTNIPSASAQLTVKSTSTAFSPLVLQNASGQTASSQEWQNAMGSVLAYVSSTGDIFSYSTVTGASVSGYTIARGAILASDTDLTLRYTASGSPTQDANINVNRGTSPAVGIRWNETTDKWQFTNDGTTYKDLGSGGITVSDTAPSTPATGDLWYESDTGSTYVYYDSYWIEIGGSTAYDQIIGTIQAKGDLLAGTASQAIARLAVGTNGTRLVADSTTSTGLAWASDTQNTVIDAKGDLLVGLADNTVGKLTVGTNGQILVADSSQTTGVGWAAPPPNFRNALINGGFQIDQRNVGGVQTIIAGFPLTYTADRWYAYCTGANVTGQQIAGAAPFQNYYRFNGAAANTAVGFGQRIEASNSFHFAGQTATLSAFLASTTLTTITWTMFYANISNTFGTLASPTRTQIATGTFTINSTLTRYQTSVSIPAAATTGIEVVFTTGAFTSGTLTFAGAQLELGAAALPFEVRPYGAELALCQRYYEKTYDLGLNPGSATNNGFVGVGGPDGVASTYFFSSWRYKVEKRTTPTVTVYDTSGNSGKITTWQSGGTTHNVTPSNGNWVNGTNAHSVLHQGSVAGWFYQAVSSAEL